MEIMLGVFMGVALLFMIVDFISEDGVVPPARVVAMLLLAVGLAIWGFYWLSIISA